MVKLVLIAGGVAAVAALCLTVFTGFDATERNGRIALPGKATLQLDANTYGVFYEEQVKTGRNEVFHPPPGIKVRVKGTDGAPNPKLDLSAFGDQLKTDNRTTEQIGTLRVKEKGRYRVVVGPPPRVGAGPAITIGERVSTNFIRGAKRAGLIAALAGLLALLIVGTRRGRGGREHTGVLGRSSGMTRARPADLMPTRAPPPTSVPPGPVSPPAPMTDPPAQLERLAELRRAGAISEEELQRLKADLLSTSPQPTKGVAS